MRADRLLSLLLILQAKGQRTAGQLSRELHVSERTIYRDIEALSYAGIPIYTRDGRGGGIALEENYRISLTGLNKQEIQSLFVSGSVAPLSDLGLANANENTLLKLLAALPSLHRAEAQRVRQRILIDPHDWFDNEQPSQFLSLIQEAVLSDEVVNIRYQRANGTILEREIQTYGLVAKASIWYVIGKHEDKFRTYRVSRLDDVQLTDQSFVRDPDFTLRDHWKMTSQEFVDNMPEYYVTIAVPASQMPELANHPLLNTSQATPTDDPDWIKIRLRFERLEQAVSSLIGIVCHIRVVDPPELHNALLKYARETLAWLEADSSRQL